MCIVDESQLNNNLLGWGATKLVDYSQIQPKMLLLLPPFFPIFQSNDQN